MQQEIPRLSEELSDAAALVNDATDALKAYLARFRAFRRIDVPPDDVDRAERVLRGGKLTTLEEAKWQENPWAKKAAIAYVAKKRVFASNERTLAAELKEATNHHASLAEQLDAARRRLAQAPNELRASQVALDNGGPLLATAEKDLGRISAERDRLRRELAAAESRHAAQIANAQKRAAEEYRRLAEQELAVRKAAERGTLAQAPSWDSGRRSGLSSLPPVIRTLVLAQAAGWDEGLDLSPGDESPSPFVQGRGAVLPQILVGPASIMHSDGMGVTHRQGNQTLVERADGPSALYTRQGQRESVQYGNGTHGLRCYHDARGVVQFRYRNPSEGVETIGEEPYWGNDFGQGWSHTAPLQ